jgi:hypothetical protein
VEFGSEFVDAGRTDTEVYEVGDELLVDNIEDNIVDEVDEALDVIEDFTVEDGVEVIAEVGLTTTVAVVYSVTTSVDAGLTVTIQPVSLISFNSRR